MSLLQCILNKRNVQQADIKKSKQFLLLWKGFCELTSQLLSLKYSLAINLRDDTEPKF